LRLGIPRAITYYVNIIYYHLHNKNRTKSTHTHRGQNASF